MASEDERTALNLAADVSVGDGPRLERTSLAIGAGANDSAPILHGVLRKRPDGQKDGNETGEQEEEVPIDGGRIAGKASINRDGPPFELPEPPSRPKPPRLSIVKQLEAQAELASKSIIGPVGVEAGAADQTRQTGAFDDAYSIYYSSNHNSEGTPLALLQNRRDVPVNYNTAAVFRHGKSHPTQSISSTPPEEVHSWQPNQYATLQSLKVHYHRHSPEFSHLANNLGEATNLEVSNLIPRAASPENLQDFIGRIEKDVLDEPGNYGNGRGISPGGLHTLRGRLGNEQIRLTGHTMSLSDPETPALWETARSPPGHGTASRSPDFGSNPPVIDSLYNKEQSRVALKAGFEINDDHMSRFWRPNQYNI